MSFDLFVGLPHKRLLWAKDVVDYYDTETDWDAHDEQPRDLILPAILRMFTKADSVSTKPDTVEASLRTRHLGLSCEPTRGAVRMTDV